MWPHLPSRSPRPCQAPTPRTMAWYLESFSLARGRQLRVSRPLGNEDSSWNSEVTACPPLAAPPCYSECFHIHVSRLCVANWSKVLWLPMRTSQPEFKSLLYHLLFVILGMMRFVSVSSSGNRANESIYLTGFVGRNTWAKACELFGTRAGP